MTSWSVAAILVLALAAGGVSWMLLLATARGDLEPDDADGRRRARRRGRVGVVVFVIALPLAAVFWSVGSPSDVWWVVPLTVLLIAVLLFAFRLTMRRSRRRDLERAPWHLERTDSSA